MRVDRQSAGAIRDDRMERIVHPVDRILHRPIADGRVLAGDEQHRHVSDVGRQRLADIGAAHFLDAACRHDGALPV